MLDGLLEDIKEGKVTEIAITNQFLPYQEFCDKIFLALRDNKTVTKVDFSRLDDFYGDKVEDLIIMLQYNNTITSVNLSDTFFVKDDCMVTEWLVKNFLETLEVNKTLTHVDISNIDIKDEDIQALNEALAKNKILQEDTQNLKVEETNYFVEKLEKNEFIKDSTGQSQLDGQEDYKGNTVTTFNSNEINIDYHPHDYLGVTGDHVDHNI
ncbi:MAG: hypothetical protein RCG15_05880 [Candidatus Rickettsia vulgarisii]